MGAVAQKVSELEKAMMELVYQSRLTEMNINRLSEEMREFKDEMREFKNNTEMDIKRRSEEMREFKNTSEMNINRLSDEMREFKNNTEMNINRLSDEMREFKNNTEMDINRRSEEMREFKNTMDKRWGDLARKMGTLIEDIFIPSFDPMIEKYFGLTLKDVMPRRKVRKNEETLELDILAYAGEKAFVVEVKSSPDRVEYVHDFLEKLKTLPDFIPEIKKYQVIPIYAALNMEKSTINLLTKNHIYALIVKGDILEIVNFQEIK